MSETATLLIKFTDADNKMLKLKPNCECCDIDLPAASDEARICSFECTFCIDCAKHNFSDTCPNCGGELVKRPVRSPEPLAEHPASSTRFINQKHAGQSNFAGKRVGDRGDSVLGKF